MITCSCHLTWREKHLLISALVNSCAVWLVVSCMYSELTKVATLSSKNPMKHSLESSARLQLLLGLFFLDLCLLIKIIIKLCDISVEVLHPKKEPPHVMVLNYLAKVSALMINFFHTFLIVSTCPLSNTIRKQSRSFWNVSYFIPASQLYLIVSEPELVSSFLEWQLFQSYIYIIMICIIIIYTIYHILYSINYNVVLSRAEKISDDL